MKQSIYLTFLSSANIGIAFLFQWYVLTQLGPGLESDALFAGMTIPQLVLAVISGSLMHVLVPILAGENEDRLRCDAWALLVLVGGLFGFLAVVLYSTASWWVPLTVPGFDAAGKILTVELTRIQLIGMVFTAINGVQWAAYHARQKFIWAEFTPVIIGIFTFMLLIWALPRFGVSAAAWIASLRMALQAVLLAPGMGRPVRPNLRSPAIQQAWHRIKPLLLGTAYYKTDPVVDRFLLSTASSGSLSLYYLAQQIYGAVSQIINKAIVAPLVPILSRLHKLGDKRSFRKAYYRRLWQVGGLGIAGLFVLGICGQAVLNLLVSYGSFRSNNVTELWWIMICLGGLFVGSILGQISSSSFYALGDTSTPTRLGIYSYTIYVPVKFTLFYYFDIWGLATATSAFFILNFSLQNRLLKKTLLNLTASTISND